MLAMYLAVLDDRSSEEQFIGILLTKIKEKPHTAAATWNFNKGSIMTSAGLTHLLASVMKYGIAAMFQI